MIWNLLGCDFCGMLLDRRAWLRGRPRAGLLRAGAVSKTKWQRISFDQRTGAIVDQRDQAGLKRSDKAKGTETLDICAVCARGSHAEIEMEYRRRFPLPAVRTESHLDEWGS